MVRIVTLTEADAGRYQAFCEGRPDYLVYYSWKYRELLLRLLGCRAIYLGAVGASGDLIAAFPLMAKDGPYGTVINSLPFFGSHGGIIGNPPAARRALLDAYAELTGAPGVAAATAIMNPLTAETPHYPHDFIDERIGQFSSLEGAQEPQAVLDRIAASARYDVRMSQRAGVSVAIENDAFEALQRMHVERMQALSGKPKPDAFFRLLPELFETGRDFNLYTARIDGKLVAMVLLLYAGRVVEYFIPVVEPAYRRSQATAGILFQAMQDAAARGYTLWNWGGTWLSQEGVLRFKSNWGATRNSYFYYTRLCDQRLLEATAEDLLAAYDGFYVLPFGQLRPAGTRAETAESKKGARR